VILVYCWCCDMPQLQMSREANVAHPDTVMDWCNFMREECEVWIQRNSGEIGGIDDNGVPIVVEIDETKFLPPKIPPRSVEGRSLGLRRN
jgi:hypothetical protein